MDKFEGVEWGNKHPKPSKSLKEMERLGLYKPSPRPNPIKPKIGSIKPLQGNLRGNRYQIPAPLEFEEANVFFNHEEAPPKILKEYHREY